MLPLLFSQIAVAQSTQSITNPTSVLSIFLSLLVVVGVIFALAYVMRRFNVTAMGGNQMKVAASMVVGTKEKIIVIQVGEEQHLIGVTSHNISHLSKLSTPIVPTSSNGPDGKTAFQQKLVQAMASGLTKNKQERRDDE